MAWSERASGCSRVCAIQAEQPAAPSWDGPGTTGVAWRVDGSREILFLQIGQIRPDQDHQEPGSASGPEYLPSHAIAEVAVAWPRILA